MSQTIEQINYQHFLSLVEENEGLAAFIRDALAIEFGEADAAYLTSLAATLEDRNAQLKAFIHAMKAALDKSQSDAEKLIIANRDRARFGRQQVLMNLMSTLEVDTPDEAELVIDLLHGNVDERLMELFGEEALSALRGYVYQVTQYQEETVYEDYLGDAS